MRRQLSIFAVLITVTLMLPLSISLPHRLGAASSIVSAAFQAPVNLALNKPATQSSTASSGSIIAHAGLAVDGNTNGNFFNGSVSHTQPDNQAWWQVDLTAIGLIEEVHIYNRTDCCPERLNNYYVLVSDVPFVSTDLDATISQPEVSSYLQFVPAGSPTIVNVNRTGRYLRIQLSGANVLHMAEVQVIGTQLSTDPAVVGQWGPIQQFPDIPVHISLLPSGKLLFWGRDKILAPGGFDVESGCNTHLWDPVSNTFTLIPNNRTNLFCSGHSFLPDGRLFVAGGREIPTDNNGIKRYEIEAHGPRHTNIFDYVTESWSAGPDMRLGRWYPSLVTLGNGETLIVTGSYVSSFNQNNDPVHARDRDTEILALNGTLRNTIDGMPAALPVYPFVHLDQNGNVLAVSGTNTNGLSYNPLANLWNNTGNLGLKQFHDQGTSVMFERGKVMAIGGLLTASTVTPNTEVIDLTQMNPSWDLAAPMKFARVHATSVLMPDGRVFVVGGSRCGPFSIRTVNGSCTGGAVMNPEVYNPSTAWSIMARHQVLRTYHSVALLLPDARILIAGGGRPGAQGENGQIVRDRFLAHTDAEIFSPPYLFNSDGTPATRPAIIGAPQRIVYGQSFNVAVANIPTNQVGQVALVRLPSVTHGLNFDQLRVPLSFVVSGSQSLSVVAPAAGDECPPGPYMLFVMGQNGAPSMAAFLFVGNIAPPPPPSGLVATALSNSGVSVTWIGSGVPIDHYELERSQSIFGPFTRIGEFTTTSFTDSNITGLTGQTAYLYRVRAVDSQNIASGYSNIDLATTMSFTDNPLVAGGTIVKAQHINELRTAVNAARTAAGLPQVGWTDTALPGTVIKAMHIYELRQNLNQALAAIGLAPPSYTDPLLAAGLIVKKVHVEEVRQTTK